MSTSQTHVAGSGLKTLPNARMSTLSFVPPPSSAGVPAIQSQLLCTIFEHTSIY
ncbi:hypothetical protein BDV38DRAFT_246654 [Aspergillus pseudotamarii]|uniref:Uncharacterized protein n=1 Tax=Aspergillus pseudotamarii TaxID=132259 RepID=A0A5N6SSK7_ASPPS|nr:uncharacterized protein BDV38DRAFT_246654 [Aspergillus pseudotamarii]KAE8137666.1 hypothetical protein BDV38DRAFT_246654 [Aspergillus pseudotamarii]